MIEVLRSRENLISLAVGFVFGIGLAIGGMTQPGKVIGFWILLETGTLA